MVDRLLAILKNNKTVLNGGLFTFFSFANQGISFILLLIVAHYIAPGEYGQLNLYVVFVQLFSTIITLGSDAYIQVAFFKKDRYYFNMVLNSVMLIATGVLCSLLMVLSFFSGLFSQLIGIEVRYQWMALFVCYMTVFNNMNLNIWIFEEKPVSYGVYSLSTAILNFILTLILVITFQQGWLGRLYAQISVTVVFFIISILFLIKRKYLIFKMPHNVHVKNALSFGVPLIPHAASGWLKQGADRYIINGFLSVASVGLYSFAMNFSNIILTIGTAFNQTNSVYLYKNLKEGYLISKAKLRRRERRMGLFFFLITIAVAIACYFFIPLVVPKYADSAIFIFPLCFSAMFNCFYLLFVNYLLYYGKTKQLMSITFTSSTIQVILSFLFTRYGAIYTAMVFMLMQGFTFMGVFLYSRKLLANQEIEELKNKKYE